MEQEGTFSGTEITIPEVRSRTQRDFVSSYNQYESNPQWFDWKCPPERIEALKERFKRVSENGRALVVEFDMNRTNEFNKNANAQYTYPHVRFQLFYRSSLQQVVIREAWQKKGENVFGAYEFIREQRYLDEYAQESMEWFAEHIYNTIGTDTVQGSRTPSDITPLYYFETEDEVLNEHLPSVTLSGPYGVEGELLIQLYWVMMDFYVENLNKPRPIPVFDSISKSRWMSPCPPKILFERMKDLPDFQPGSNGDPRPNPDKGQFVVRINDVIDSIQRVVLEHTQEGMRAIYGFNCSPASTNCPPDRIEMMKELFRSTGPLCLMCIFTIDDDLLSDELNKGVVFAVYWNHQEQRMKYLTYGDEQGRSDSLFLTERPSDTPHEKKCKQAFREKVRGRLRKEPFTREDEWQEAQLVERRWRTVPDEERNFNDDAPRVTSDNFDDHTPETFERVYWFLLDFYLENLDRENNLSRKRFPRLEVFEEYFQ